MLLSIDDLQAPLLKTDVLWAPHPGPQTFILSVNGIYEMLFGGSRGGGKTDAGQVWMAKPVFQGFERYRGLVIRRNAKDLADWLNRAKYMYPGAKITGKPATITWPGGQEIVTGHLKDENAYEQYQGHEYQRMLIEELTQIPYEERFEMLLGSCRSTIPGLQAEFMGTTNPGGPGHMWVKKRWRIGEKETWGKPFIIPKDEDSVSKGDSFRMFLPANIHDNPTLIQQDPQYLRYLENLHEPLRSAWLRGDWDVFAGQFFLEWEPKRHVISLEQAKALGFGRPNNKRFGGIDWGFAAPFCMLWAEATHDNKVIHYRELYGKERYPWQWGEDIQKIMANEPLDAVFGDPSMWIRNPLSWKSDATPMYSTRSIGHCLSSFIPGLVPANNARVSGWQNMAQLMTGEVPNYYIIAGTCPNLERTIPVMIRDEKNVEDLDTDLEDHPVDADRYLLSHITAPVATPAEKPLLQRQIDELLRGPVEESWGYDYTKGAD